jgi:hypothetical protein
MASDAAGTVATLLDLTAIGIEYAVVNIRLIRCVQREQLVETNTGVPVRELPDG